MVGPVSVLPTLRGSFLSSEGQIWLLFYQLVFFHVAWAAKLKLYTYYYVMSVLAVNHY
jgi:hypothetical protein